LEIKKTPDSEKPKLS